MSRTLPSLSVALRAVVRLPAAAFTWAMPWRGRAPIMAVMITSASMLVPSAALSHGAIVDAEPVQAVSVVARYDTGEPMSMAQIIVFAPHDPVQPNLRGVADAEGRFVFVPDPLPGRWTIQARSAGHGAMAYVVLESGGAASAGGPVMLSATVGAIDPLQRWIMAASVIWGLVGTALYFRRRPA